MRDEPNGRDTDAKNVIRKELAEAVLKLPTEQLLSVWQKRLPNCLRGEIMRHCCGREGVLVVQSFGSVLHGALHFT